MSIMGLFAWFWESFGLAGVLAVLTIILVAVLIIFRRYISALIMDYVIDCALSFLDNLIAGMGLAGLDAGDLVAAIIIFFKERKITGNVWAAIAALEAFNFLLGLIPVIGEPIEIFFNFLPAVTILRALFGKFGEASTKIQTTKEDIKLAKELGVRISKKERRGLKKAESLVSAENPIAAIEEIEKVSKRISSKLKKAVDSYISETQQAINSIREQLGPIPQLDQSQSLVNEAKSLYDEGKFKASVDKANEAREILSTLAAQ